MPLPLHVFLEIPNGTVILQGANRNDTCTGTGHVKVEKEQETFRHRGVKKFQEAGFKAVEVSVELKTNEEKE